MVLATTPAGRGADAPAVPLPPGVEAVWDMRQAQHEATATRERICLNGLWRWQPAGAGTDVVPSEGWGFFKVPGCWPGITDYLQKDSQTVFAHPSWKDAAVRNITAAWHQREFRVPEEWTGRRIALTAEYVNSYAAVFVDGQKAGEIRFPAGEVDLTRLCRPGSPQVLSLLVLALPLKGVMLSYTDTASAREAAGTVERRGLCGDVFLVSTPAGARLTEVKIDTSGRSGEITLNAALQGLQPGAAYSLAARLTADGDDVVEFRSGAFNPSDLTNDRLAFTHHWRPKRLWDVHTPQNQCALRLSLLDASDKTLDTLPPARFGFREFWIEGRDFYLNGSRIFLSAVPLDNAQIGAAAATYAAARESLERLRSFGINFVYTHNYGCEPGAHLSFSEILRAADDVGMLVALTQPHFSHYEWSGPDADRTNGYAQQAAFYTRVAQNHPSVVMYATSHNATGYNEDMNPDLIDGIQDRRDQWAQNNVKKALRAEAIIHSLDPGRIVYHHASGNLGALHAINFYPNFVPVQELSDWFGHWATQGVKPVFLCEYGAPFTWDWAMYRGWYRGQREFGSAVVPWEFCLAEWNAQFLGDRAFAISEMEKQNLRWEAKQFREGKLWHRWDYPHQLGSKDFPEREPVFARYYAANWRAFRTWGVSANSPWEHDALFKLRPGLNRNRREALPVDWTNLQRPGFSPDYQAERYERMDLAYERSDWVPTAGALALRRNNGPLLAYLGGKPARFTSQDHVFAGGEILEKQIIVINNSRRPVKCDCSWLLALPTPVEGRTTVAVETGQQARIPLTIGLPSTVAPGEYKLTGKFAFDTGETQEDEFVIHVLARRAPPQIVGRIALFDPPGKSAALLRAQGVRFEVVEASADLAGFELLIVGTGALTISGAAPDMLRVREGLKVLLFEQSAQVLEQRCGFRVAEYGLRNVIARVPDHPVLAGLTTEHLRDWRGEATLLPARLQYELNPKFNGAPSVSWCGLPVTRAWRCGGQGNVASVLIEKPACGDFRPILDGGFSLQYSPLMEYREGRGLILFCQMDVTARTEGEPAAATLVANLLAYVSAWKPAPTREVRYVGDDTGRAHLEASGFPVRAYATAELKPDQLLVVGPGGGVTLAAHRDAVDSFLGHDGHLLAIGLDQQNATAFLPFNVAIKPAEHINAFFDPPLAGSALAGIGPADVHNRAPRTLPLVSSSTEAVGDGVLAVAAGSKVVFCQLVPWQFAYQENPGLRRTFRRSSFLLTRLLGNLGAASATPLLTRLSTPVVGNETSRWLPGLYLDTPEEWDDPYRFFRW